MCPEMNELLKPHSEIDPEWGNIVEPETQEESSLLQVLGKNTIFSRLQKHELEQLVDIVHVRNFKTGECVIRRGAKQSGFYLIQSGSVHILKERDDHSQVRLAQLYPNDLISEFSIFDDSPRSTFVVAAEPCLLIGFFKPDLLDIMVTNPSMGCTIILRLLEDMSQSLNKDYRRLCDLGYPFVDEAIKDSELDPTLS